MKNSYEKDYSDIINLPHPSLKHPRMSLRARAAQFSPFAALDGYEAAVKETERITEEKVELDEYEKESLDKRLFIIKEHLSEKHVVTITYFRQDEYKEGGSYPMITGVIRKIDNFQKVLIMESGEIISVNDIVDMDSSLFRELL